VLGLWHRLRVEGTKYHRAGAIATEQRGFVSRDQLLQAGLTYAVIRRLVARYFLIPDHPGVFAVGHVPVDVPLARETAALLAVRSPGWLSHQSAAAVWGLTCMDDYAGPVHVTVTGGSAPRRRGVRVHRTASLDPSDRRIHNDLPVTSPARMLLDVAADFTDRELERAYDQVLVKRLTRESDVRRVLAAANGHRGRKRLQSVVDTHDETTLTRSEAEERMLMLIRGSGLPQPAVNHRVHGFEVDFYWPRERLVLEVDGFRYHSTPKAFQRDRERDTILRMHAISSMRVTWHQLDERPFEVIARLAWTLAIAEPAEAELSMN
jgi:very-short-patch-repair endonuclease